MTTPAPPDPPRWEAPVAIWLAVLAPLAWLPGGFVAFVFPKLLLTAVACAVGARAAAQGRLPRPVAVVAAAGGVVLVVAALASETPVASLFGRWPRYEGLPVLAVYAGAAWLGARLFGRGRTESLEVLGRAAALAAVVLAAFSGLDALGASPLGSIDVSRSGSLLGDATDQGMVAAMLGAVLLPAALRRERAAMTGTVAALLTVALSGSRSAMLAVVVSLVVLAVLHGRRALGGLAVAGVGLVAAVLALPQGRDRLTSGSVTGGRELLWEHALQAARDHPVLGIGPSRFVDVIGRYEDAEWLRRVGLDDPPDSPQAWPLQALLAGGPLLLVLALALAALVAVIGLRRARRHPALAGVLAAVAGYGVALLANATIAGPTCLAAFLVGALVAVEVTGDEPAFVRPTALVAATVAGLIMLGSSVSELELQRGVQAAGRDDVDQARTHLRAAARWRPWDGDVHMIGAQALAGAADAGSRSAPPVAAEQARASLRRTPDTYPSLLALGVALNAAQRYDLAVAPLTRAVLAYPSRPAVLIQRGIARFGLQDVEGARNDLLAAKRLDPTDQVPDDLLLQIAQQVG